MTYATEIVEQYRIETFEERPEYSGSQALVEVRGVDVLWDPPEIIGLLDQYARR